ncbi:hypothetical protein E4U21_002644 [Claviceps maximensis]|nr:hypothetical protein E4U21_002644 [Claviceps maximensis]
MFRLAGRLRPVAMNQSIGLQKRRYNILSIHSSFPATLSYYRPKNLSSLYDIAELDSRPDDLYHEGVRIAPNGLVYPGVETAALSNGAVMFPPNTLNMQEHYRQYADDFLDLREITPDMEAPQIYTVPKGTLIPSHLILIREWMTKFSLQPSQGMPLRDLNRALDDFFDKSATKEDAISWINRHPWEFKISDSDDSVWMAK